LLTRAGLWLLGRLGRHAARLPGLSAWTRHRSLPVISGETFRERWHSKKN
jgi:hypothetical protein